MNFEDIRKSNPFVFNVLTDKIRNHLQNCKKKQQRIQKIDVLDHSVNEAEAMSIYESNKEKQTDQAEMKYNAIQMAIINRLTPKLQNKNDKNYVQKLQQPEKTQEQQPIQERKITLNQQFLKRSIEQIYMKKRQKIQKQAKQAKQAQQTNKKINSQMAKNIQNEQLYPNYEKLAAKKSLEIIQIKSDSDQKNQDEINLREKPEVNTNPNKKSTQKKQKKILNDQQRLKALSKDINLLSKLGNRYPNININQIRSKIFQNNNFHTELSQQNQQKVIRPQLQIKKPYKKQSNLLNKRQKDHEVGDPRSEIIKFPKTYQFKPQFEDEGRAVNRYNEEMMKRAKMHAENISYNSKITPQINQPWTDFYIHIDLLPEKEVDMVKINQANHLQSNESAFKNNKQSTKYSSDKYRQQRIQEYFGVKDKNFINKIHKEIDKGMVQEKMPQDHLTNAKKSSKKNSLLYPQSQLKLQSNDYQQFIHRRIKKKGSPNDLGVLTIDEIVEQCYIKGIIGQQMYVEYINQSSRQKIKEFINYFIERKLNKWNFQEIKITLMDHRRLSELLVNLYPKEYIIYSPHSIQKDINDFLANLYLLSTTDYKQLLDSLDQISGISFWKTFKIKYSKYLNVPVKVIPYFPENVHKNNQLSYEQQTSPVKRTQNDTYTAAEKQIIQKYKNSKSKKYNNFRYDNQSFSSSEGQSSDLSPENNRKYGKQIKRPNKKGMNSRKRIH